MQRCPCNGSLVCFVSQPVTNIFGKSFVNNGLNICKTIKRYMLKFCKMTYEYDVNFLDDLYAYNLSGCISLTSTISCDSNTRLANANTETLIHACGCLSVYHEFLTEFSFQVYSNDSFNTQFTGQSITRSMDAVIWLFVVWYRSISPMPFRFASLAPG